MDHKGINKLVEHVKSVKVGLEKKKKEKIKDENKPSK